MTLPHFIEQGDVTLHLPRILCLHGGGTNARIFRAQCRTIRRLLSTTFRLVFAEAPFSSQAGPDVLSVYRTWGPFKCWLPWSATKQADIKPYSAIDRVEGSLKVAMEGDDQLGATGPWVGLLGFSQGAKMCASLLYSQQQLAEQLGPYHPKACRWRFAVLLAGRGPLVSLQPGQPMMDEATSQVLVKNALCVPTIHVHGMQDPGLEEHRMLLHSWCATGATRLMEWDGDHRVPIKTKDVIALVTHIWAVAAETGVPIQIDLSTLKSSSALLRNPLSSAIMT